MVKAKKQVAALPVMFAEGAWRVLLITSRDTGRFVIPKGWPMKGRRDRRAAAIEARQEAGVLGRIHPVPVGTYTYWKRRADHFDYCRVKVYLLEVTGQLIRWREMGERRAAWMLVEDAAELVDEPGLVMLIRDLPAVLPRKGKAARALARRAGPQ